MRKDIVADSVAASVGPAVFRRRLLAATPRVFVTRLLVLANVGYFGWNVLQGADPWQPETETLIAFGANYPPLTTGGEPWRLVTSMFLHVGIIHIGFNMWVLWQVGNLVERLFGNAAFLLLYFVAGIGGSVASVLTSQGAPSAGASGAVFGVFGALIAYLLTQRRSIPLPVLSALKSSALAFVGYNVLFGFLVPFIDNAAHLGGLGGGFVSGVVLARPLNPRGVRTRALRNLVFAVASVALMSWLFSWIGGLERPDRWAVARLEPELAAAEQRGMQAYNDAVEQLERGAIDEETFRARVRRDVLPVWGEALSKLEGLDPADLRLEDQDRLLLLRRYLRLRQDGAQAILLGLRADDPKQVDEGRRLHIEADKIAQKLQSR